MRTSRPTLVALLAIALSTVACSHHAQLVHMGSGRVLRGTMHKGGPGSCRMEFRGPADERLSGVCELTGVGPDVRVGAYTPDRRSIRPRISTRYEPLHGAIRLTGGDTVLNCAFDVRRLSWHGEGTCRADNGDDYRLIF
jgi:hypothetical protein